MKYLFWLLIAVLVWWAWRRNSQAKARPQPPTTPAAPQDMVVCLHCGVHLPQAEAVAGTLGPYCSTAHRSAAGDRNPG